jgi:hydroxyethylthiazole kinase
VPSPDRRVRALHAAHTEARPLVHCLTNVVAARFSADALLSVGASPAMVEDAEETAEIAAVADAVVLNTGTMTHPRAEGMAAAARAAGDAGVPWLLDPVAVGALGLRTRVATDLLAAAPSAVRGNASEVAALAGGGPGGRGVDSTADVDDAADAAAALARRIAPGGAVAVSGPRDLVTDGTTSRRIGGGDPVMARVTGTGCALGAVMGAFLAAARRTGDDAVTAVAVASALVGATGAAAARASTGPGTFVPAWLDRLADPDLDAAAGLLS